MSDSPLTWFHRGIERFDAARAARPGADVLAVAHAVGDALAEAAPERADRACAAGCAYCCHFTVGVTAIEADRIAAAVTAHPDRARLEASIRERAAAPPAPGRRARCALLGADDRCAVYADRPLACRGWTSTDREGCRLEHLGLGGIPRPEAAMHAGHLGIVAALAVATGEVALPTARAELHAALAARLTVERVGAP